jgi:hypothetical protein
VLNPSIFLCNSLKNKGLGDEMQDFRNVNFIFSYFFEGKFEFLQTECWVARNPTYGCPKTLEGCVAVIPPEVDRGGCEKRQTPPANSLDNSNRRR